MVQRQSPPSGFSLRRWSRLKHEAARAPASEAQSEGEARPRPTEAPAFGVPPGSADPAARPDPTGPAAPEGQPRPATGASPASLREAPALPPVESLSIDSDFGAFMQPAVEEGVRRAALKRLFSDAHFNVMDGLDVYIDDYSKFEPLTEAEARGLAHVKSLFDPPRMRVLPSGEAVPVVPGEEEAAEAPAAAHPGVPDEHAGTPDGGAAGDGPTTPTEESTLEVAGASEPQRAAPERDPGAPERDPSATVPAASPEDPFR